MSKNYKFKFEKLGGISQVVLESGDDLKNLKNLDQKLWATLCCPASNLEFDQKTLNFIDIENDGKIRAYDILSTIAWLEEALNSLDILTQNKDFLELQEINTQTNLGQNILIACREILKNINKLDANTICINDISNAIELFMATSYNGDGIIEERSDEVGTAIKFIIENFKSIKNSVNKDGINQEILNNFYIEIDNLKNNKIELENAIKDIFYDKNEAKEQIDLYLKLKDKIDDFFIKNSIIAYDEKSKEAFNPDFQMYKDLTVTKNIQNLPLCIMGKSSGGTGGSGENENESASGNENASKNNNENADNIEKLNLKKGINPYFKEDLKIFADKTILKITNECNTLEQKGWGEIKIKLDEIAILIDKNKQNPLLLLEMEDLDVFDEFLKKEIEKEIEKDLNYKEIMNSILMAEKLLYLRVNFFTFLNNFITFKNFYEQKQKAIFQAGTLYIDGRSCHLCLRVENIAKHSTMALLSATYIAYCECSNSKTKEKILIAACISAGDADNIMVGRNGVFYDSTGDDYDATVIKILDFPISVSQAFWSPYKKIARLISEQIEKFAKAKEGEIVTKSANAGATGATTIMQKQDDKIDKSIDMGKFAGIFAALGLAIGALGTAFASIVSSFFSLNFWQMPLALGGILLLISGPSMLLAYMKLGQRNIAPLLDANGWAVNTKAKISVLFGRTLTKTVFDVPNVAFVGKI